LVQGRLELIDRVRANGWKRRILAVGAHPDERPEVHRTRPVPFATREARFGVGNGRLLCELTGAGSDRTFVIKAVPEPAPGGEILKHSSAPWPLPHASG